MGKADLTNLFIEGQKVSLEAVNITVDDRKKYPGWQERVENFEHFWLWIRPALPVQAPSHLGLDQQVPAEKRHRQNCSWVRSRQQLVCRHFHPISITRVDLGVVSSSNFWLFGCHQFKSRIDGQRRVTFPEVMKEITFLAWQQLSSSYAPPPHSTRCKYALAIKPEGPFLWLDGTQ